MTSSARLVSNRDWATRGRVGVGGYLRDLREARGAAQEEVADNVGACISFISKAENGTGGPPSSRAEAMATAVGADLRQLGLMMFGHKEPHLFAMVFPDAFPLVPLDIPESDMKRAMARLNWRVAQLKGEAGA